MKISKGRLKQIIQEEMGQLEETEPVYQEQVEPETLMLAVKALGKILSDPVLAAGIALVAGQQGVAALQRMAEKDAEVMAQRPELDEAQEAQSYETNKNKT